MIYARNMVIQLDKDWVTDYTFDFSSELTEIDAVTVVSDTGISVTNATIVNLNTITVRITGGTTNTRYQVTVTVTAPNGERRDMTVTFHTL